MGRVYWMRKLTVEECNSIDVFWLNRNNFFRGLTRGVIEWTRRNGKKNSVLITVNTIDTPKFIKFNYSLTNKSTRKQEMMDYKIPLVSTPCNFGGERYWFVCSGVSREGICCRKRVAKFYLGGDGKYFCCRHCYNLSYASRNKNRRGPYYSLVEYLDITDRIEKLEKEIKIHYRNGRPTKKYRKLTGEIQKMVKINF